MSFDFGYVYFVGFSSGFIACATCVLVFVFTRK